MSRLNKLCERGLWGLAVGAALFLALPSAPVQAEKKEILIGGSLGLSGTFAGATKPFKKLADAWAERVNERGGIRLSQLGKSLPVRFIIYDDQTSPPTALRLYERLATVDKVDVFIGPYSSFITNAALQASITHKIPFFMVEANDAVLFEQPNKWRATGLAPAASEYTRVAQVLAAKRGLKTFALLGRDNLHERGSLHGMGKLLREAGFKVVYEQLAPKKTKDFSSIILAIKQKNPDAVLVEALPPPWTLGFLKQARELGLNPKEVIAGHIGFPVVKGMGKSGENITSFTYYFEGDTKDHRELYAISKAVGIEPWQYPETGLRYRGFRRIEDALRRAGTLDREAVRKAMWETNLRLYGEEVIEHDAKGYGTDIPYPTQIQGGKVISLWPLARGMKRHRFKNHKW
jgi:ABC-type branched-subunit amino acid transport system substrate-binding protein